MYHLSYLVPLQIMYLDFYVPRQNDLAESNIWVALSVHLYGDFMPLTLKAYLYIKTRLWYING